MLPKPNNILLDHISQALLYESVDHKILYINDSFCNTFKIPVESKYLIGQDCKDAAIQSAHLLKNPDEFLTKIKIIYEELQPCYNDVIVFNNGDVYLRDYQPIYENEIIVGHFWSYKNISAHADKIGIGNTRSNILEKMFDNIPADIVIFDTSHRYIFLNKTAIVNPEIRKWIVGKDDFDYAAYRNKSTEIAVIRREVFNRAMTEKKIQQFEETGVDRNNKPMYNLRSFQPVCDEDGNVEYVIGYGINITSVRERERIVRLQYERIIKLFNSIEQMVIIIDQSFNVRFSNLQWNVVTGLTDMNLKNKEFKNITYSDYNLFISLLENFFSNNMHTPENNFISLKLPEDSIKTYKYYITNYFRDSEFTYDAAIIFRDITDELNAEKELMLNMERAKELSKIKSNFMSMISHELRTPLSVILSSTEILGFLTEKEDNHIKDSFPPFLKKIETQVNRMTQLMNDFLIISKVEAGKIHPIPKLMSIIDKVNSIMDDAYNPYVDGRALKIEVRGSPKQVLMDEGMIEQMLHNMISNAFKYSLVQTQSPILRIRFSEKYWAILVADHGIGISKQDMLEIGEPFKRGGNIEDIQGTGLGLNILKNFTQLCNGKLSIRSKVNEGSVFQILFLDNSKYE